MKVNRSIKIAVISAVTIGAGLGAFSIVHAVTNKQPVSDPSMTPQVKLIDIPTPSPSPTPDESVENAALTSDVPTGEDAPQAAPGDDTDPQTVEPAASPAPQSIIIPTINAGPPVPAPASSEPINVPADTIRVNDFMPAN